MFVYPAIILLTKRLHSHYADTWRRPRYDMRIIRTGFPSSSSGEVPSVTLSLQIRRPNIYKFVCYLAYLSSGLVNKWLTKINSRLF